MIDVNLHHKENSLLLGDPEQEKSKNSVDALRILDSKIVSRTDPLEDYD